MEYLFFAIEIKFKTKEDLLSSVLYTVKDGINVVLPRNVLGSADHL